MNELTTVVLPSLRDFRTAFCGWHKMQVESRGTRMTVHT